MVVLTMVSATPSYISPGSTLYRNQVGSCFSVPSQDRGWIVMKGGADYPAPKVRRRMRWTRTARGGRSQLDLSHTSACRQTWR
jgi:hypothetical protein